MSDGRGEASEAFALCADPSAYVPSPARERALSQLLAALDAGAVPCLEGPTGIGKTMLLHTLVTRVDAHFTPLYLPYPALSTRELCALALGLYGSPPAADPELVVQRLAAERSLGGRPLLLLIDDAASLPAETARGLVALLSASQGALRVALAGIGGEALLTATAPFGDALLRVGLNEGIEQASLRDYVSAQLEHAHAPDSLRAAFDDNVLAELGRLAAGNPRRLHLAAQDVLRRAQALAPAGERVPEPPAPTPPLAAAPPAPVAAPIVFPVVTPVAPAELRIPSAPPVAVTPPVVATPPPAPAQERRPTSRPPSDDAAALGEYRMVRGRKVRATPEPASGSPPAAQVDLTLAPLLAAPSEPAPARAQSSAAPRSAPQPTPARRGPPLGLIVGVAAVSAAFGFLLASHLGQGKGALSGSEPTPTPPTHPAPATPVAAIPSAAPAPAATSEPAPDSAAAAPAPPTVAEIEISINATPWAVVEVDGRVLGETPLGGVRLTPGSHRFRARFPDGRVGERVVEVDAAHRTLVFE